MALHAASSTAMKEAARGVMIMLDRVLILISVCVCMQRSRRCWRQDGREQWAQRCTPPLSLAISAPRWPFKEELRR